MIKQNEVEKRLDLYYTTVTGDGYPGKIMEFHSLGKLGNIRGFYVLQINHDFFHSFIALHSIL